MLSTRVFETRGAKLIAAMMVALLISSMLVFGLGGAALAATDYDGDGAIDNDCEPLDPAVHPGATDHPDLAFEDLNCDGIDGDQDGAYFVMPSGSDSNVGTDNAPFQTIQKAIDAARTTSTKAIYVATGTYNQRLSLPADADGIRIYGGYAAGTWTRTTTPTTTVNGQPEAMLLDGATDVVVQLVTLNGTRGAGLSAYGVRAVNNSEVALIRTRAVAGSGADGANGAAGSQPAKAANGAPGKTQTVPQGLGGTPCDYPGAGGSGSQFGNGTDGGAGGMGGEETNDGENGAAGAEGGGGALGGDPGAGGTDNAGDADNPAIVENGTDGQMGASGASGSHGAGGTNDLNAAGATWSGRTGSDGTDGGPGYGGGGGGGGAGDGAGYGWSTGAGGGQGGDGGAGGTRGFRGDWGGGSFGLYLHNSQATVVDGSTLQAGNGGRGGHGGAGGAGGAGGDGGPGGVPFDCPNKEGGYGGDGGAGGSGGSGGSGGGGSGGPSIAIARLGSSLATVHASSVTAGTPGSGGVGPGLAGDGATGQSGGMVPGASPVTDFDGDGITDSSDACVEILRGTTDNNGDGCPDRPAKVADTFAPTIDAGRLMPANLQTGVPRNTNVGATFSEEMKAETLTSITFKLQQQYTKNNKKRWRTIPTTLTLSNGGKTATLNPYGDTESTGTETLLAANKKFRGFITTGAKDLAGNPLARNFFWTFRTGA